MRGRDGTNLLVVEPLAQTVEHDCAALDDAELDWLDGNGDVGHVLGWPLQVLLVHREGDDVPDGLDEIERHHVKGGKRVEVDLMI